MWNFLRKNFFCEQVSSSKSSRPKKLRMEEAKGKVAAKPVAMWRPGATSFAMRRPLPHKADFETRAAYDEAMDFHREHMSTA